MYTLVKRKQLESQTLLFTIMHLSFVALQDSTDVKVLLEGEKKEWPVFPKDRFSKRLFILCYIFSGKKKMRKSS